MIGIQSQSLTPRALKDAPVINTEKIEPGSERGGGEVNEVNPRRKNEHPRPPSASGVAREFARKTRTAYRGLNRRRTVRLDEETIKSRAVK